MALASLLVIVFMVLGWNASKGWTRQVPTRFQSWVELVGGFMYGLSKQVAGSNARILFPLVATIFVFLLAVNWMKLLPGVESVGVLHCAEEGFSSYPMVQIGSGAYQLFVDTPLNAGTSATHEDYEHCEDYKKHPERKPTSEQITAVTTEMIAAEDTLIAELDAAGVPENQRQARIDALRAEYVAQLYANAKFPLSAEQLREGAVPYGFVITPYVRGGSTDLNLTIGLALISVVSIQIFGVLKQGPGYFSKFVNLPALGNLSKNPPRCGRFHRRHH